MDEVVFGKPAAEAVADQARRLDASRVFLLVSGTLNRKTEEVANIRKMLGNPTPEPSMPCCHTRRGPVSSPPPNRRAKPRWISWSRSAVAR
jgi:hypothetical protein